MATLYNLGSSEQHHVLNIDTGFGGEGSDGSIMLIVLDPTHFYAVCLQRTHDPNLRGEAPLLIKSPIGVRSAKVPSERGYVPSLPADDI